RLRDLPVRAHDVRHPRRGALPRLGLRRLPPPRRRVRCEPGGGITWRRRLAARMPTGERRPARSPGRRRTPCAACRSCWPVHSPPVSFWGGVPLHRRGTAGDAVARPNMFTLYPVGNVTAYGYSVVAALAPDAFPASFRGHGGEVPLYFEAAAVITSLVLLG